MTVSFLYLLLFRLNLRVFLRLELAAKIRKHRAENGARDAPDHLRCRGKVRRNDDERGGKHDADDGVISDGVVRVEKPAHNAGKQRHHAGHAKPPGDEHGKIKLRDAVDQRREKADRHQDGRRRHPRDDEAEAPQHAAEEKAPEVCGHLGK